MDEIESIDDLDETKLLGYFETIRGVFLTKLVFLLQVLDQNGCFKSDRLSENVLQILEESCPDELFYKAIRKGNEELIVNYREDVVTAGIFSSWIVFEQIIKDLPHPNYSGSKDDLKADYHRSDFGFSHQEKEILGVIHYIRNAMLHYNGAYYSYRDIDCKYLGKQFKSQGNYGTKIVLSASEALTIIRDIERLTIKAWDNFRKINNKSVV